MGHMLIGNAFLILFLALFAMFVFGGSEYEDRPPRWVIFVGTVWVSLALSVFVRVVAIVFHYAVKYW